MAQLKAAGITEDELRSSLLQEAMVSRHTKLYQYSNKYSWEEVHKKTILTLSSSTLDTQTQYIHVHTGPKPSTSDSSCEYFWSGR